MADVVHRVDAIEPRIESLEEARKVSAEELRANTEITQQTKVRVDEVYALLETARGAFRIAGKVGNGVLWLVDRAGRVRQGHAIVAAVIVAGVIYWRTGKLPDWLLKFMGP